MIAVILNAGIVAVALTGVTLACLHHLRSTRIRDLLVNRDLALRALRDAPDHWIDYRVSVRLHIGYIEDQLLKLGHKLERAAHKINP